MLKSIELAGKKYVHDGTTLKIYNIKGGHWQFYLGCVVKHPDLIISKETKLPVSEIADMWEIVE